MKTYFLIILLWAAWGNTLLAQELQILTVEEPPGSFTDTQGRVDGFSISIVREIQRRVGNADPIRIVPEARALFRGRHSPNTVLIGFSRTPDREADFHWIMPLFRKPWVMYARKEFPHELEKLEAARKVKTIGVVRGDVRALHLEKLGFDNLISVPSHEQNIKMLLQGRIQMFFYEPQGVAILSKKLGIPMSRFKSVLETTPSDVYILMSRQTPMEIVTAWRNAGDQLIKEGGIQAILNRWEPVFKDYGIHCRLEDGVLRFTP